MTTVATTETLRTRAGRALERGLPLLAPLGFLHGALAPISRVLRAAPGVVVVAIGGATIGGSGRTALALSCAEYMHACGARVAIVGHAYRARPGAAPRIVSTTDSLPEVGDEARMLARALGDRVKVVVADQRQHALDLACALADVVLLDGVLQTTPQRAHLSLLAVREELPWGSGRVVPAGDLRAPRSRLLAACDLEVPVRIPEGPAASALRGARVGVLTAIARPERLLSALAHAGLDVRAHVNLGDHGALDLARVATAVTAATATSEITTWVVTPKCAEHLLPLQDLLDLHGTPVVCLEGRAELSPAVSSALASLAGKDAPRPRRRTLAALTGL